MGSASADRHVQFWVGGGKGKGGWVWSVFVSLELWFLWLEQSRNRVDTDKSVLDFVYHAGFV